MEKQHPRDERLFFIEYGNTFGELEPFLRRELGRSHTPTPALPSPGYCYGRKREVEEVVSALLANDPQPLPIMGGPGMGKTTIALKALHDKGVATRFANRRWFVRCDGVKSRTELAAAIARVLDIPITPSVEHSVLHALTMAPGALVLDNAETPLDADATQVEELLSILATIESLALVVTIRGHKRPRGVPWRSGTETVRLTNNAAREAFIAAAGKSRFATDPYLPRLLGVLDGVPLAITLMARLAEVFDSLEPVWSRWGAKRTAMLKDGEEPDRLKNIAVSYEFSISILSVNALRLLSVLALLPDGVAQVDLEGVFADPDDAADELRRRALVFDETYRLRMLGPLRDYVAAAHSPTPADERRAVEHYLKIAANEGKKVGAAGGADAVTRLAPEVANSEAMLGRALSGEYEGVASAVHGWAELMRFTGLGSTDAIEQVADHAVAHGNITDAARCLKSLGDIALQRSNHETARRRYEQALHLYQTKGDLVGEADCIQSLGDIALERSNHDTARERYEQALLLYQQSGNLLGEASCTRNLGHIALRRSDVETAHERYDRALLLYQESGNVLGEANCFKGLGNIALRQSDHETSRRLYEKALPLYRTVGDLAGEANCIRSFGDIAFQRADHETARRRYDQALPLYRRVGDLLGEANCIVRLGDIMFEQADFETARERYEQALPLYGTVGDLLGEANCITSLGDIALASSEHRAARDHYERALPLYQQVGDVLGQGNCIRSLGDIARDVGKRDEAESRYREALVLYGQLPEPYSVGETHLRLAALATNDDSRATQVAAARMAWRGIKRDDLVAELDAKFGTTDS